MCAAQHPSLIASHIRIREWEYIYSHRNFFHAHFAKMTDTNVIFSCVRLNGKICAFSPNTLLMIWHLECIAIRYTHALSYSFTWTRCMCVRARLHFNRQVYRRLQMQCSAIAAEYVNRQSSAIYCTILACPRQCARYDTRLRYHSQH